MSLIGDHIGRSVLEVGAGIGANTFAHALDPGRTWTCVEPDAELLTALRDEAERRKRTDIETVCGVITDLPETRTFDTILYIDVLEHIRDDRREVHDAVRRLEPGGKLVVLSPAFSLLFSPFDAAIGHFRRYRKRILTELVPPPLEPVVLRYLDSVGFLLSVANRLLLRQSAPTLGQILFWDRRIVPISRRVDPIVRHAFGRSILGVWRKG